MKKQNKLMAMSGFALLSMALVLTFVSATDPGTNGQPSQSCGSSNAFLMPNGFNTAGFANAASVYAGSDGTASLLHANSANAVSQYDVACFQLTQNTL